MLNDVITSEKTGPSFRRTAFEGVASPGILDAELSIEGEAVRALPPQLRFEATRNNFEPAVLDLDPPKAVLPEIIRQVLAAATRTAKKSWFWYSMGSLMCWTGWAFTARLGSREIPAASMQYISAYGFLLVAIVFATTRKLEFKKDVRANGCALMSGILLGLGGMALYGAYRDGSNTSVVTAITSLYPVVTVILAGIFLREKLNKLQALGLWFAAVAILVFAL